MEEWVRMAKFNTTYFLAGGGSPPPPRSTWKLFLAALDARVSSESDLDDCCETLAQLVLDQRKQPLARDFFHRDQLPGESDEEFARSLQRLAEQALRGVPPNKVKNWPAIQFKARIQPPALAAKLRVETTANLPKTNRRPAPRPRWKHPRPSRRPGFRQRHPDYTTV